MGVAIQKALSLRTTNGSEAINHLLLQTCDSSNIVRWIATLHQQIRCWFVCNDDLSTYLIPAKTGGYLLLSLCLWFSFLAPAQAQSSCYSPKEAWAEQVLRLHSELMVVAVACRAGEAGPSLIAAYTGFTRNNRELIQQAESYMQDHYESAGECESIHSVDQLRTRLANEYGLVASKTGASAFCHQYQDKVLRMKNVSKSALDREVQLASAANQTYKPICSTNN